MVTSVQTKTWAKPFTIGGFVAGEVYMFFTALAPNLKGTTVPLEAMIQRCLALSIFMGVFGAAVGAGIWMIGHGLGQKFGSKKTAASAAGEAGIVNAKEIAADGPVKSGEGEGKL